MHHNHDNSPPNLFIISNIICFVFQHFQVGPDAYSTTQLMIATCYRKLGQKDEAKHWFQRLINYPSYRDEDYQNVSKAKEELKSL